jgi:carbonic anhydrase
LELRSVHAGIAVHAHWCAEVTMQQLLAGMMRFQNEVFPRQRHLYQGLASSQQPHTLFVGCSDSRVVPSEMLQTRPGELFVCRNAGNIVPAHGDSLGGVSATVEYAVEVLKVKHLVVCGHSDCGAMRAVMRPETVQKLRAVAQWIRHAERVAAVARELHGEGDGYEYLNRLIEENVITQLDNLVTHPCVAAKMRSGNLQLHGMVFDLPTGSFKVLDRQNHKFLALDTFMIEKGAMSNV